MRGDTKSRYEAHAIALGNSQTPGWQSINEIRRMENLNPVADGDELQKTYTQDAPLEPVALLQRMNAKEAKAVRAESNRCEPEKFDKWLAKFYNRMSEDLVRDGVELSIALEWAECRMEQINNAPDVAALMDEWENA